MFIDPVTNQPTTLVEFFSNNENLARKCFAQCKDGTVTHKICEATRLDLIGAIRKFYPHRYSEIVAAIQERIGKRSIALWYDIVGQDKIVELCKELDL